MKKEWGIQFQHVTPDRTIHAWSFNSTDGYTRIILPPHFVSSSKASYGVQHYKRSPYSFENIQLDPWDIYMFLSFTPDNQQKQAEAMREKINYSRTLIQDYGELVAALIADYRLRQVKALMGITNPTMADILTKKFGFKEDPNMLDDEDFNNFNAYECTKKNKSNRFIIAPTEAVIEKFQRYQGKTVHTDRVPQSKDSAHLLLNLFGKQISLTLRQ